MPGGAGTNYGYLAQIKSFLLARFCWKMSGQGHCWLVNVPAGGKAELES